MNDLFRRKNAEYDDAIEDTGVLGAVTALAGDVGKLRTLVVKNPTHGQNCGGNVKDKLRDVAVQAIIGIMMAEEENWDGR